MKKNESNDRAIRQQAADLANSIHLGGGCPKTNNQEPNWSFNWIDDPDIPMRGRKFICKDCGFVLFEFTEDEQPPHWRIPIENSLISQITHSPISIENNKRLVQLTHIFLALPPEAQNELIEFGQHKQEKYR